MLKVLGSKLFISFVFCCVLCSWTRAASASLTDAEVRTFMQQMEQVTQQRDYASVVSLMAPQIRIHYLLNGQSSKREIDLSRTEYLQNAIAGGMSYSNYQYRTQIVSIKLMGNQAQVYFKAYERATSKDRGTIDCVMNDVAVVEKKQNQLLMTVLNGKGAMSNQRLF